MAGLLHGSRNHGTQKLSQPVLKTNSCSTRQVGEQFFRSFLPPAAVGDVKLKLFAHPQVLGFAQAASGCGLDTAAYSINNTSLQMH
jgi:hypothetical protein